MKTHNVSLWKSIEKTIGSMKFAVILISIFGFLMIVGTFLESYYGTSFASRFLYKSPLFIFVQFLLFLSILFATLLRLPYKKRLGGFYILHTGLLLIGAGSFITWFSGIDGSITLYPKDPNREVVLSQEILKMNFPDESKVVTRKLPHSAFPSHINDKYQNIKILKYIPFAENIIEWAQVPSGTRSDLINQSSQYYLSNDNVSQKFILTLHPKAIGFDSSLTLGPLRIHYLPREMKKCFSLNLNSKFFFWDNQSLTCSSLKEKKIKILKTKNNHRFFYLKSKNSILTYFPEISPYPLDKELNPITTSKLKVFSLLPFEKGPQLFLFGDSLSYYDSNEKKWIGESFNKKSIQLPWMDFKIKLLKNENKKIPQNIPQYTTPIQSKGSLIKGDFQAVSLEIQNKKYWVTSLTPLSLMIDGKKAHFALTRETFRLPFEIVLEKFQMKTNPGTMMAASYESFLHIFSAQGSQREHVYMNNPFKKDGLTFYQASYQQDPKTKQYLSTLSVNVDPGRAIKYLGSLLLVIGSMLHFLVLNRR